MFFLLFPLVESTGKVTAEKSENAVYNIVYPKAMVFLLVVNRLLH